ncbi:MAG: serpin family protein, partial [Bacteroidia bacterium]|nr:serpin family protein [Bacteroidia bacterium]
WLPRFSISYGIKKLNDPLIQLGMELPFSSYADLSGIREGTYISRVLHKAVIDVNEEGSEAAGVTVVEVQETAMMEPTIFRCDKPFLFLISEEDSDTILFIGTYMKP